MTIGLFLASLLLSVTTDSYCTDDGTGVPIVTLTATNGLMLVAGALVLWLWRPVARQATAAGCSGGLLVAVAAMTVWVMTSYTILITLFAIGNTVLTGSVGSGLSLLTGLVVSMALAAGAYRALESRPMHAMLWDRLAASRRGSMWLMLCLGCFGLAALSSALVTSIALLYAAVGPCHF